jgi:hypothetical protein
MFSSRKSKFSILFVLFVMLFAPLFLVKTVRAAQVTWIVETVDPAEDVGEYCSMRIDTNNHVHIAYYDAYWQNLKYAYFDGAAWSMEPPVDSGAGENVGKYCSLALDSNNRPHISYFDEGNYDLKYAWWTGSVWSIQTVDNLASGGYTSIALDSTDNPHISYYDYNFTSLKYARWTGSAWSIETVDSPSGSETVGEGSSIAITPNDEPMIAYRSSAEGLKLAVPIGTGWSIEVLDSVAVRDPYVLVDSFNDLHISYYDEDSGNLIYAIYDSAGTLMLKELVDASLNVGRWNSLALDSYGNAHISYYDLHWQDLKYAKRQPGEEWIVKTIDTVGDQGFMGTSIALDSNDRPHISYYDATNHDLKFAKDPDETLGFTGYDAFDSDGDLLEDSVTVFMDIDTDYAGSLNVTVSAILLDPSQNIVDDASSVLTINANLTDSNNLTLTVPAGSPEGSYSIKLFLADEIGNSEDSLTLSNAAYLYPLGANQSGILQGTVTDFETGLPWVGACVYVADDIIFTNATGQYSISLPPGEYSIWASDEEGSLYSSEFVNVTVTGNTATIQDLQLKRTNWILSIESVGSGTIEVEEFLIEVEPPIMVTIPINDTAYVHAFPSDGWSFDHWILEEENIGSSNPVGVLMDSDHLLTVVFTEQAEAGWVAGTVRDSDTGEPIEAAEVTANYHSVLTDAAGNYELELPPGEYNVTAQEALHFSQTVLVTVNASQITVQNFTLERSHWMLIVEVEGSGSTNLTQGSHSFPVGSSVAVEALPDTDWMLSQWLLDSVNAGSENPFNVSMDSDHVLRAVFEETPVIPEVSAQLVMTLLLVATLLVVVIFRKQSQKLSNPII